MGGNVLIVTGGFVSVKDRSPRHALRKPVAAFKASDAPWYDIHLKVLNAEHLLVVRRHQSSLSFRRTPYRDAVEPYFADERVFEPPELAAVILSTGYGQAGRAQEIVDEGMMGFVQKPYDLALLSRVVRRSLRKTPPG
ncbi:MAG: hypothetical protein ISR64_08925 [Deltaproteobacteria bacterium]|nr:hypothetical protein [Deltaproteobacteria bacterium]